MPSSSYKLKDIYAFGDYRLDVLERILWRGDVRVPLPDKAFEILCLLVKQPHRLISKDELLDAVWPDTIVEENNVAKNISLVRKTLGLRSDGSEFIETVRGHGFRFIADVRQESFGPPREKFFGREGLPASDRSSLAGAEDDACSIDSSNVPAESAGTIPGTTRTVRYVYVGLATVCLAGFIFLFAYTSRDSPPAESPITSIAVLPFSNGSGDPELAYLCDGLSETLIDRLSEFPQLKVIARTSSFRYRGDDIDVSDVTNKLGVQAVITGRVAERGGDLTIRVDLVGADNRQIWGEEFREKRSEALLFQKEIPQSIVRRLQLKLSGEDLRTFSNKRDTQNPQAYELLLRGRFERQKPEPENHRKAIDYFQQAIVVDPTYAIAFAELSLSYTLGIAVPDPNESLSKAAAAARTALELDPDLAEAHHALGGILLNQWDWSGAEREYRRAIELNANLARGYAGYAHYLTVMGRHEEAIAASQRGKELDPLSPRANVSLGWALLMSGNHDESIEIFKKSERRRHSNLGFAYAGKGMYGEAAAEFEHAIKDIGALPSDKIYLAASYAKVGQTKKARAILRQIEASERYLSPVELAYVYTALDEKDKAFELLGTAFVAHDPQLQNLNIDFFLDDLRADPRFAELVRRVGLPNRM